MPPGIFARLRVVPWTLAAACLCGQAAVRPSSASAQPRVQVVAGVAVLLPSPWVLSNRTNNAVEIAYPRSPDRSQGAAIAGQKPATAQELVTAEAQIVILVETRRDHEDALYRLAQIADDVKGQNAQWTVISGWPAVLTEYRARLPAPGGTASQGDSAGLALHSGLSLAAGSMVVRLETVLLPGADPGVLEEARQIARRVEVKEGDPKIAERDLRRLSPSTGSSAGPPTR